MTEVEMNCPLSHENGADILLDYSAGRLDRLRSARLARHMESCHECAAFRDAQNAVWSALDEWEPAPVSMDFNRRLWQRIDRTAARPWYLRLRDSLGSTMWKPAIPLGAAALVVVAAFVMDQRETLSINPAVHGVGARGPSSIEVKQVEETLDDVQLLKQFDSTVTEAGASKAM
jgi:anti-sigma factor RsiW